jgi:glycosyltransferase involved in cell wall biosynthesis
MIMDVVFIVFLVGAGTQIVFNLVFLIQLAKYRIREHILDIDDKPVSIVVCSHNNFDQLKNLLEKLYIQAYRDFEIVVVDDRSDDGTYEFLLGEEKKRENLKLVRVDSTPGHINEKKYALTLGIKAAGNDVILLTDSDCEPVSVNWIHHMVNQFDNHINFVLGFSYYKRYPGFLNMFIRHETLQTALLYLNFAMAGIPYMGVGRNLAYRKSFFLENNGFKGMQKLVGGDDDLFVNRYAKGENTDIVVHWESTILSEPRKKTGSYFRQKIRHLSTGKKYKWKHILLLSLFTFTKLIFWIAFLILSVNQYQLYWVAGLFLITVLLTLWLFRQIAKKYGVKYEYGWVWIMDFVYISYLTIFSLAAILSKRIKWN